MPVHPIQPLVVDANGVTRFKENNIVIHLIDNGSISLNDLAELDFSAEDRMQFAQLLGYSHSGFGTLSYVTDSVYEAAGKNSADYIAQLNDRIASLEGQLANMREHIQGAMDILEKI